MGRPLVIVGGGLLGCLTALRISDATSRGVCLVEAGDNVLGSLEAIEVGPDVVNRGFHSLETPRDSGLAEFIRGTLGVPMTARRQSRGLGIEGQLIAASDSAKDWPQPLRDIIPQEPVLLDSLEDTSWISTDYRRLLSHVGQRYGGFDSGKHLLIPWFFPPNVSLRTSDEGDRFRDGVRAGEVTAFSAQPVGGLFAPVAAAARQQLHESGVRVVLNSPIGASPETLRTEIADAVGFSDFDLVWCAPAAPLLWKMAPERFVPLRPTKRIRVLATIDVDLASKIQAFTEMLVLDSKIIEITRVSPVGPHVDLFSRGLIEMSFAPSDWSNVSENSLESAVKEFGMRYRLDVSLRGFREVGETFSPPRGWDAVSRRIVEAAMTSVDGLVGSVIYFAPFNMAKAWLEAQGLLSRVKSEG